MMRFLAKDFSLAKYLARVLPAKHQKMQKVCEKATDPGSKRRCIFEQLDILPKNVRSRDYPLMEPSPFLESDDCWE